MSLTLQPSVLRWACQRAGLGEAALAGKLGTTPKRIAEWEQDGPLRFAQVQKLAHVTHTPQDFLFLPSPPDGELRVCCHSVSGR